MRISDKTLPDMTTFLDMKRHIPWLTPQGTARFWTGRRIVPHCLDGSWLDWTNSLFTANLDEYGALWPIYEPTWSNVVVVMA